MSESVEPLAETTAPTAETAVHWTGTLAPELKALAASGKLGRRST